MCGKYLSLFVSHFMSSLFIAVRLGIDLLVLQPSMHDFLINLIMISIVLCFGIEKQDNTTHARLKYLIIFLTNFHRPCLDIITLPRMFLSLDHVGQV